MKTIRNSRGMTLVEILIVLAIIGTLMAVLLPNVVGQLNKSRQKNTRIAMTQVSNALNLYYTDCGKFPATLDGLTKADADCGNWGPEPYLKKEIKDAWNNSIIFEKSGSSYTLKSLGADGREGGDGYNKDISSEDDN